MAYGDGFVRRGTYRYWNWSGGDQANHPTPHPGRPPSQLRVADVHEASALYEWWLRSSAHASDGLIHRRWSFAATSSLEWAQSARAGNLLVWHDFDPRSARLPPITALIMRNEGAAAGGWTIATLSATGRQWRELSAALVGYALSLGAMEIWGLLPDCYEVYTGLRDAGYAPDPDDDRLVLFELDLGTT
jgi:hypothetical protein